jgi:hypothetical protein
MNSVGRWPIFFFISFLPQLPNTSPKVHRKKELFKAVFPEPVLTADGAGLYAGLPGTATGPQPDLRSGGGPGPGPA